ncbi:myelin protein zero-like protein 2b [Anabas testudineus]|uniref:myelin protein zero-like protein 2b n=1 Tax=Anabas testudineus TaxID=64144 RepID=UPI000E45CEFB|nr:myelin protein zero-like protein 2b [Anabas testudineus]
MFNPVFRTWLLFFLGALVPGVRHVSGIEIYTPSEIEAVNGTDVKLKCTFSSTQPVTLTTAVVSWSFRGINSKVDESVFYYQESGHPPLEGRFKDHVVWSGDVLKKDASITLQKVQPTFNGTYICQVRNRPDVHGISGEITLKVVDKVSMSEIGMLAAAVGGACAVVLVLLAIVVAVRFHRRKKMEKDIELHHPKPGVL